MFFGVRLRYANHREKILVFLNWWAAEYYLMMIPAMMMAKNPDVEGVISARVLPCSWASGEC